MKKVYMVIAVLIFTFMPIVRAEENVNRKLAEELLTLTNTKGNIERMVESMKQMQISQIKKLALSTGNADKAQALTERIMDVVTKEMSWDNLKDDYIAIYADTFTEDELKGLIAFYEGPLGQKLISKTPDLMKRSIEVSKKKWRK